MRTGPSKTKVLLETPYFVFPANQTKDFVISHLFAATGHTTEPLNLITIITSNNPYLLTYL